MELLARSLLKRDPRNVHSSIHISFVDVTVAVLHVVSKTRVGDTKILGNDILAVSTYWEVVLEIFNSSLLKRDPRNVCSSVARMLVDVIVAVLHVVLKTHIVETKTLGIGILA